MTETQPLLLVDFDRTLFDTSRFSTHWWGWLAETYRLDPVREMGRIEEYFNYVGEWRNYDFYRHVADLRLDDSVDVVCAKAHEALKECGFLFPDSKAVEALARERPVEIVTFGNKPYQRYKLSYCPQLSSWRQHIIDSEKGEYIKQQFGARPTILVDDKMLAGTLPASTRFIHLDRGQLDRVVTHDDYISINTLSALKDVL